MSGAEEALCAGSPATPFAGGTHGMDRGRVAAGIKKFGAVSRFGLKNEQPELSSSAGLCQFAKWNESTKLNFSEMGHGAPKSAVPATWRPKSGPPLVWLCKFVRASRPVRDSIQLFTFMSPEV